MIASATLILLCQLAAKRRCAVLFSEKIMLIPPYPIAFLAIDKSVY
jgi:hypothetical protein